MIPQQRLADHPSHIHIPYTYVTQTAYIPLRTHTYGISRQLHGFIMRDDLVMDLHFQDTRDGCIDLRLGDLTTYYCLV